MCHLGARLWRPTLSGGCSGRARKRAGVGRRSALAQQGCVLERVQECPAVRGMGMRPEVRERTEGWSDLMGGGGGGGRVVKLLLLSKHSLIYYILCIWAVQCNS